MRRELVPTDLQEGRARQRLDDAVLPISGFGLQSADYLRMGEDLAAAGLPTVFVFEGGYAVEEIGVNAVNVLDGFQQRAG